MIPVQLSSGVARIVGYIGHAHAVARHAAGLGNLGNYSSIQPLTRNGEPICYADGEYDGCH